MKQLKTENSFSDERFRVIYKIRGDKKRAFESAQDICLEQTVEFPFELLPEGLIKESVIGRIESFDEKEKEIFEACISYSVETASKELTQLLNVIFGNISIKPGIQVKSVDSGNTLFKQFKGPRFGRTGLRELLGVKKRPLLATALKPMGLSSEELGRLAYKFAVGGIDLIKDDHGLSNQVYAPFESRVEACVKAVNKANAETGLRSRYIPNITAPFDEIYKRAHFAKEAGAGGLMIAPGITGLDTMRSLAENDDLALPIISHPAFQGSFAINFSGISHFVLFGQLARLAGADATIYPNFGGRFSFSKDECLDIVRGTNIAMGNISTIFPCPGGGMSLTNIPQMAQVYDNDVIFLIGGGLFKAGPDLTQNCRYFKELIEKHYTHL